MPEPDTRIDARPFNFPEPKRALQDPFKSGIGHGPADDVECRVSRFSRRTGNHTVGAFEFDCLLQLSGRPSNWRTCRQLIMLIQNNCDFFRGGRRRFRAEAESGQAGNLF